MSRIRRLRGIGRRLLQSPIRSSTPSANANASGPLTFRSLTPETGIPRTQQPISRTTSEKPGLTSSLLARKAHVIPDEAYNVLTESLKHNDVAFSIFGVEALLSYKFKDPSLLWEAVADGNRRLALVRDAVLTLALASDMHSQGESPGMSL